MKKRIIGICLAMMMFFSTISETFWANNSVIFTDNAEQIENNTDVYEGSGARLTSSSNIKVNTTYTGKLDDEYDVNKYNFTLSSAGVISIDFQHENLFDTERYWVITIYDESTEYMMQLDSNGTDTNITSAELGLPAGDYYVEIESSDSAGNPNNYSDKMYTFKINYTVSSTWETEDNYSFSNADIIAVNTDYSGVNMSEYDVDYYKFSLNQAGKISINFQHEIINDTERYWVSSIYNESTEYMMQLDSNGTDTNITSAELGLPAGNYYVKVESSDSAGNPNNHSDKTYTFKINYTVSSTWETEDNYNYSNADIISVNKEYNGATLTSGDVDYYKFVVNQAGKYTINFQHKNLKDTDRYWKLNLYNINTKELLSTDVKGSGTSKNSSSIYLKKGTYYLRITTDEYGQYYGNHSNTTYKFKVCFTFMTKKPTLKTTSIDFNKVKLKWSKVADIKGYVVYRSTSQNGKYKAIKTINGKDNCTYTDKSVKAGKTYYYKVRAYKKISGKTYYSKYSSVIKVKPVPTIASIKNVKLKNRNVTLTWKKQSGVSGYEIYMSTKKSSGYKKIETVKKASSVKYTKKTLKVGKRYYFKVRAYKVVGDKKVYGKFSAIKSIKIKQEVR